MRTTAASTGSLSRFRYHTGAQPVPLAADEPCPLLFRDIGFEAMDRFLRGNLQRLCGPVSPITYLRTAEYIEPYEDYGRIGRILVLRPRLVNPWFSGIPSVYIAAGDTPVDPSNMVLVPAGISLTDAAATFADVQCRAELEEVVGRHWYADAVADTQDRLQVLIQTHTETEQLAAPLRRLYQSMNQRDRDRAAEQMQKAQLTESDLCTAWHHLPDSRRAYIRTALTEMAMMETGSVGR